MQQPLMADLSPRIDGPDVTPADQQRLTGQRARVLALMLDGSKWWTLKQIAWRCECSETSASARLRDFRKSRFGSYTVERRRKSQGTWEYRVTK